MKELSIEEKAKRYDEAIKKAGERYNEEYTSTLERSTLAYVFPELKEPEDERIRKEMIEILKKEAHDFPSSVIAEKSHTWIVWLEKQGEYVNFRNKIQVGDKVTRNEDGVLVNLSQLKRVAKKDEKQGEQKQELLTKEKALKNSPFVGQKPAEWSEEDENHVKSILSTLECCKAQFTNAQAVVEAYNADIDWLKSLRPQKPIGWTMQDEEELDIAIKTLEEAGQYSSANWLKNVCLVPQSKQEWSEEDNKRKLSIISSVTYCNEKYPNKKEYEKDINWLKSLRPQNTWKPSKEQLVVLNDIIINGHLSNANERILKGLQEQLKKLKD